MSATYDVVVIGGGHNGLTAAAALARSGRKTLLLERRPILGGLAASEEFHPGYRSAGLLHDSGALSPRAVEQLDLAAHGLRLRSGLDDMLALGSSGTNLWLPGDRALAAAEIRAWSERDAERYGEYHAFVDRVRPALATFLNGPPLDLVGLSATDWRGWLRQGFALRRLRRTTMLELLRLFPMCVSDWLDEWFESEPLKATLALPAIAGSFLGPRSPGSNANLLLWSAAQGRGVVGGGPALIEALVAAARDQGVEIRTSSPVTRVLTGSTGVRGVRIEDGAEIAARAVAASCDPQHAMLDLVARDSLELSTRRRIEQLRSRGTTAWLLLALNAPPRFATQPDARVLFARSARTLNDLERAFDAIKYRRFSELPALDIHVPTVERPELAPDGHAVLSILVHFAPYTLEPGWSDEARRKLEQKVFAILERHAPGLTSSVVAQKLLAPPELEARFGITGGQMHHLEHSLDQRLVRPIPECTGYRTPLPGFFLCGSGSHPGGGLSCIPGLLAAETIDRGSRGRAR